MVFIHRFRVTNKSDDTLMPSGNQVPTGKEKPCRQESSGAVTKKIVGVFSSGAQRQIVVQLRDQKP